MEDKEEQKVSLKDFEKMEARASCYYREMHKYKNKLDIEKDYSFDIVFGFVGGIIFYGIIICYFVF